MINGAWCFESRFRTEQNRSEILLDVNYTVFSLSYYHFTINTVLVK